MKAFFPNSISSTCWKSGRWPPLKEVVWCMSRSSFKGLNKARQPLELAFRREMWLWCKMTFWLKLYQTEMLLRPSEKLCKLYLFLKESKVLCYRIVKWALLLPPISKTMYHTPYKSNRMVLSKQNQATILGEKKKTSSVQQSYQLQNMNGLSEEECFFFCS